ncbi:Pentatricopeptide repeat-containing protein [Apostasia shenzhenica]|uniref:Pentatricopeptide repeat-containing protein n=1 Tax=Apostasia shenzhenica TaxID=1088818 RepID=A0A2I0A6J7_9ASPA|nr:Pentatricopeptide repeat-containing protein [Apostasia shenzhenica]
MPFLDNLITSSPANRSKLFAPTSSQCQHLMTHSSLSEQNMVKTSELYLSSEEEDTNSDSIYIRKLCRSGKLLDAVSFLRDLYDRQIHLDLHDYNILLEAACEASNFDVFREIFRKLLLSSIPPDSNSYNNVAKALLDVSDANILLKFIREVSEITVLKAPTVVNRIMFDTAKSGQTDKTIMMFEELKNLECKIDTVTFNTILAALGKAGRVDEMLAEFSLMKKLGHSPDIVTYNTMINCLRWLGRLDTCKDFAMEMINRGIKLDLRSYTALIDCFGRSGHVSDALRLFSEMKRYHVPSIYAYRVLIGNLNKFGNTEAALALTEEMNSSFSKLIGPEDFKQKWNRRKRIVC